MRSGKIKASHEQSRRNVCNPYVSSLPPMSLIRCGYLPCLPSSFLLRARGNFEMDAAVTDLRMGDKTKAEMGGRRRRGGGALKKKKKKKEKQGQK